MPDIVESPSKPCAKGDERADKQVEKWMATIREIEQDRQPEPKCTD